MAMRSTLVGVLLMVASVLCMQLGLAAAVNLSQWLGTLEAAALRLVWSGVVLALVIPPHPRAFTRSSVFACVSLGIVTAALIMLATAAVARLPLGTATALWFLGPLSVAFARLRGIFLVFPALATAGVLLLTDPWHGSVDPVGIAFALGNGVCSIAYILLTQRVGDCVLGLRGIAISMPTAGLIAGIVAGPALAEHLTPLLLLIGLGLAVLFPIVPQALELLALRRLTAAAFGMLMCLEPAIATIVGLIAFRQVPSLTTLTGIVLVTIAGIGAERIGARSPAGGPQFGSATAST